jgi:hypothetical protein
MDMIELMLFFWFGLTAVIKATLVAQAKVSLAEALRHFWAEDRGPELEVAYRALEQPSTSWENVDGHYR